MNNNNLMDDSSSASLFTSQRNDSSRRRRRRVHCNNHHRKRIHRTCLLFGIVILHHPSNATNIQNQNNNYNSDNNEPQQQQQAAVPLSPKQRNLQTLNLGSIECANCPSSKSQSCSGTTIDDMHCSPCATGQTWWPCNIVNECYCKDLTATKTDGGGGGGDDDAGAKCDIPLCTPNESSTKPIPYSNCQRYVTCSSGVPGSIQSCPDGQSYSESILACNINSLVSCPDDPTCDPTLTPTSSPIRKIDETISPSVSYKPTSNADMVAANSIPRPGSSSGGSTGGQEIVVLPGTGDLYELPRHAVHPSILEGLYVMDAHLSANKIVLTRELLTSPAGGSRRGGRGRGGRSNTNNDYSYMGFKSSLQTMITTGVSNTTFYIGPTTSDSSSSNTIENGRAYGLVNIATFLSMSVEDSIKFGSCDEVNTDVVGGLLPISNACGQYGLDYQNFNNNDDKKEECSKYACTLDMSMRMEANPIIMGGWKSNGGGTYTNNNGNANNNNPPRPMYCGPKMDYGGSTGHWDYVSGREVPSPAAKSAIDREDVQGCCWWGRGAIQLRGTCAYGKLNYHLGKRAHDEGRPSMFPDVDFCRDPQSVCSNEKYPNIKWIAGMFRWMTEVQTYNEGNFNYMQRLVDFVDGGLQDWTFIHGVSGIVTQGCHDPPCVEGAEFDGTSRKATFIKTLKLLGLSVNEGATATGR